MDEEKRKENEEVEEVESINENDLKDIIKDAIKESQKENRRIILTEEMLDQLVNERVNDLEAQKLDKAELAKEAEAKYKGLSGKELALKILGEEKEKILKKLSRLEPGSDEYEKVYNDFRKVNESYEEVKSNPFRKIDWSKIATTLVIVGAAGALVFLLLIIENSAYFPRSRNALNLIMSLLKAGIKL